MSPESSPPVSVTEDPRPNRRSFLQTCGAVTASAFAGTLVPKTGAAAPTRPSHLVRFGQTDLFVSRLCQGTAFRVITRVADNPEAQKILHRCLDVGVNFFDTAEAYGWGGAEGALGEAIKGRRDQVVVCTKAAPSLPPVKDATPDKFKLGEKVVLTREVLFRKAEGSLKRLGTDYLDLYLIHSPDGVTPPEEIADSMDALVRAGKTRYWGVSNFPVTQVARLHEIARSKERSRYAGTQDYYNLVAGDRRTFMERELFPALRQGNLGLMAFSPLDTGKLAPGRPVKEGSFARVVAALDRVAKELGATRPQVCIAWVLSHPEVTVALAGAEKPEHVSDNFPGTRLVLPPEALALLNAASDAYTAEQKDAKKAGG